MPEEEKLPEIADELDRLEVTDLGFVQHAITVSNVSGEPYYAPPTAPLGSLNEYVVDIPEAKDKPVVGAWFSPVFDPAVFAFPTMQLKTLSGTVYLLLSALPDSDPARVKMTINCLVSE